MFTVGQTVYPVIDGDSFDVRAVDGLVVEVKVVDDVQGQYDYVVDWALDDGTVDRNTVEGFHVTDWTKEEQERFHNV